MRMSVEERRKKNPTRVLELKNIRKTKRAHNHRALALVFRIQFVGRIDSNLFPYNPQVAVWCTDTHTPMDYIVKQAQSVI